MSRETKALITHLEHERHTISTFLHEIDVQVERGTVTRELGDQIVALEYEGRDPRAHLQMINRELAELRSLETNTQASRLDSAAPIAIVAVLAIAIVWNFGAITGLFIAGDETFYSVPFGQTITETQSIPLTITVPVTSLRVDGAIMGTGRVRIDLVKDNIPYLVASFDGARDEGVLTGFVIDETTGEIIVDNAVDDSLIETPSDDSVVLTPSVDDVPAPASPEPIASSRTQTLDTACVETCSLPRLLAPFTLRVTIIGDATVTIDDIIYGTGDEPRPVAEPETPLPETPLPETPAPEWNETPVNETSVNSTPIIPVPEVPAAQAGIVCAQDSECASGICMDDLYQGALSSKVCAPSRNAWCVAGSTLYSVNAELDDSRCTAGNTEQGRPDAVWLAMAGRGRFAIETSNSTVAARTNAKDARAPRARLGDKRPRIKELTADPLLQ